tara:strand:+ start:1892 stop:2146 length:255 start_codon:yes stop_codon:yes gene_type:complete
MIPKNVTIAGVEYVVTPPTGRDYMESLEMQDFEKACFFILRCVLVDGKPAFSSAEEVQAEPLALLLKLESVVSSLLEYEIPDPT